jgi:Fungal protein kinase
VVYELAGVKPVSLSLAFLCLIASLCFANNPYVGYDPAMSTDQQGVVKLIICCGKTLNVVDTNYETQPLVGRATHVWQVEYREKEFILKDTWVKKSRCFTGIQHFEHILGIQGIPEYVCSEDVMMDGKVICTGNIQGVRLPVMHVQWRIVISTIGSHISNFKIKWELISALRDIIISALNIFFIYVLLNSPFTQH